MFLKETGDLWAEWDRLADLRVRLLDAGSPFIDAIPFHASDYDKRTPLMHEIRQDGVALHATDTDAKNALQEATRFFDAFRALLSPPPAP